MADAGFTHAARADIPHSATSRRGMLPALAGLAVGLAYAAISVYWAVGGRWLLNTLGISLSQPGQAGHLAALLAAIGIYGLLAYAVTQRTREIGVRMALGADTGNVGRMILNDVSRLVGIGVLFGLPLAYGLSRLVNSMLYGVKAFEFLTVGSALLVMVFVAMAAAYLPARRATRVDPLVALRYE